MELTFLASAALRDAAVTTFTTTAFFVGELILPRFASALALDDAVGEVSEDRFFVASIF